MGRLRLNSSAISAPLFALMVAARLIARTLAGGPPEFFYAATLSAQSATPK